MYRSYLKRQIRTLLELLTKLHTQNAWKSHLFVLLITFEGSISTTDCVNRKKKTTNAFTVSP